MSKDSKADLSFYELTEKYPDEASAERYFMSKRWPNGVACPTCGSDKVQRGRQKKRKRQLWYCYNGECGAQFSVTSGTIMESTHLPLRKWLLAFHLMGASKKGISALQLQRMLKVGYKTAWHLCHRIRTTMVEEAQVFSGIVETDEAYIGGKKKGHGQGFRGNKIAVQAIVKRNTKGERDGRVQTIVLNNGERVDGRTVGAKLRKHTDPNKTILMTDESNIYTQVGKSFAEHHTVNHSEEEYVRLEPDGTVATTNSAEGYFANMKRKITGTHHHTSKKHLPRYTGESDYMYNSRESSDTKRAEDAIANMVGKRLFLFKPTSGKGESLFERKQLEPSKGR